MNEQVYIKVEYNEEFWVRMESVIESVIEKKQISIAHPIVSEEEPLSKIEEVAEDLGVSRQTIHDWKRRGLIPFERIGGRVYFRKSKVRAATKKIEAFSKPNR